MAIPSRLLGSGVGAQAAQNICGDVATSLTATGTTATDAYLLSAAINQFSTVAASTGAKLMPTEAGAVVTVRNSGANTLTLYPATGSTINGAASIAVPAGTSAVVFATSGTTWYGLRASAAAPATFVATLSINALSVSGVVGFTSSTSLSALVTAVNSIEAILVSFGMMAPS